MAKKPQTTTLRDWAVNKTKSTMAANKRKKNRAKKK